MLCSEGYAGYGISYLSIDRIAMYCIMQCWKGIMDLMGKGRLPRPRRRRRVPQERRQERIDRTFVVRCKVESMFMLYPCSIESISRHVLLLL